MNRHPNVLSRFSSFGLRAPVQVGHEFGAWDFALSVGFMVAALRPARAWGMLPLAGAAGVALVFAAAMDIAGGTASIAGESTHFVEIVGISFIYFMALLSRGIDRQTKFALNPN